MTEAALGEWFQSRDPALLSKVFLSSLHSMLHGKSLLLETASCLYTLTCFSMSWCRRFALGAFLRCAILPFLQHNGVAMPSASCLPWSIHTAGNVTKFRATKRVAPDVQAILDVSDVMQHNRAIFWRWYDNGGVPDLKTYALSTNLCRITVDTCNNIIAHSCTARAQC